VKHFIEEFYEAFKSHNYQGMIKHYHAEAKFWDPVFEDLPSNEVQAMWHMLVTRAKEIEIRYDDFKLDSELQRATIKWEAIYPYGPKRRIVHNKITSQFEILDGKIYRQKDTFDFKQWLGMALGPVGKIFGFTSFLQNKVKHTAQTGLKLFIQRNPQYQK